MKYIEMVRGETCDRARLGKGQERRDVSIELCALLPHSLANNPKR